MDRIKARVAILLIVGTSVFGTSVFGTISIGARDSSGTTVPFYERLLMRGTVEYESGNYSAAARTLEIASFGLMERPSLYQRAQMLLALSEEAQGNFIEARAAIRRVLQIESISPAYPPEGLAPAIRSSFEATAGRLLPDAEFPVAENLDEALPTRSRSHDERNM